MQTLNTPLDFFKYVVAEDIDALERTPSSVRLLFHAATSIHHLREWVFKAGKTPFENFDTDFCAALYRSCPALIVIRNLASNAKHFPPDLDAKGKPRAPKYTATHTAPAASSPLGPIAWGSVPEVTVTTEDGTDIEALQAIRDGFEFWKKIVDNGEWGLRVPPASEASKSP